ncbi:uncharacterized protein LOC110988342 [Acanthaster planci]|uniref:Uncharacterized protein LOC110988342 n=1 Tax=Acanthaster planci TaxID=133434 RepID=A0A8B7ZRC1_ACAPL|nr:uncharacterized protein LOC110988342 [Acanthaster planci]
MSSDNLYTVKIEPLTSGPEVVVMDSEPTMRRLDHLPREDEQKMRSHYLLAGGQDASSATAGAPCGTVQLRNTVGQPQMVDNSYANGMQAQTQLMERVKNLEAELSRAKQEIAQLKGLNTILQEGIPDVIRKTLRDELRKPRWSVLNQQDQTTHQSSTTSNKTRTGSSNSQKRHKPSPMQRAVLKARDTPAKMTKKLLTSFFDRETLATSTLTGKGDKVTSTFGISECSVRNVISQKCKEEMMIRRRRLGMDAKSSGTNTSTG